MTIRHVRFEPLFPDVTPPAKATSASAAYDLRAHVAGREIECRAAGTVTRRRCSGDAFRLTHGETAKIPLGFRSQFDESLEAQIRPRSSFGFSGILIPNAPGTIDCDYREEWIVLLANLSSTDFEIRHRERIAQVIFTSTEPVDWVIAAVMPSERSGGFGSTGRA